MTSVNKASLREKFDTLKGQFEQLCAEGKMGTDSRALFQALLMLFELLMAVFMEKRTAQNSRNSGLPPSQTEGKRTTAPLKRAPKPRAGGRNIPAAKTPAP